MSIWKKVVFGAVAGLSMAAVAHAYGPGNPASLTAVPQGFNECAVDGGVCKVPAGATAYVVYGINGKYATSQGTGDFTCLPKGWVATPSAAKPQDLGVPDPVPNVQKKCYLQVAAAAPAAAQGNKACYWMSNTPGNPWIKNGGMPAKTEAECMKLDSCSPSGGKASGGGCYKWATDAEMAPAPKACYWMSNTPGNPWIKNGGMPAKTEAECMKLDSCSPSGGKASGGGCYKWATDAEMAPAHAPALPAPVKGFSGVFEPSKWEIGNNTSRPIANMTATQINLGNDPAWGSSGTAAQIKAPANGTVEFNYAMANGTDTCPGAYGPGATTRTYLKSGNGTGKFDVKAGDAIRFAVNGKDLPTDFACKGASGSVTLVITNFSFTYK